MLLIEHLPEHQHHKLGHWTNYLPLFAGFCNILHTQEHYSHDDDDAAATAAVSVSLFFRKSVCTILANALSLTSSHSSNLSLFQSSDLVCPLCNTTKSQALLFINSPVVRRSRMMNSQSHLLLYCYIFVMPAALLHVVCHSHYTSKCSLLHENCLCCRSDKWWTKANYVQ